MQIFLLIKEKNVYGFIFVIWFRFLCWRYLKNIEMLNGLTVFLKWEKTIFYSKYSYVLPFIHSSIDRLKKADLLGDF